MNKGLRRIVVHMPHFYSYKDTKEFGKISVVSNGLRRIRLFGYSPIPYVTMSNISFTLRVELPNSSDSVYMQLADSSYRRIATVSAKETSISGIAMYTGDTKFFIVRSGYPERYIAKEGLLIFEDKVAHINDYIFGSCSIGSLLLVAAGVFLAWLLGIIQISPTWIARFTP